MKVKVEDISPRGLSLDYLEEVGELNSTLTRSDPLAAQLPDRLRVTCTLFKVRRLVRLSGALQGMIEHACARCLRRFQMPLELAFQLSLQPADEGPHSSHAVELAPDDFEFGTYRDDEVDITAMVYEQVMLALPYRALCREGCRGLCPTCGADLNEGACGCVAPQTGEKFVSLRGLKVNR